jgi:hypothetical protein
MVKRGLVRRAAVKCKSSPPCAGEDARRTAGETPALQPLARPRQRDRVQLPPPAGETPALYALASPQHRDHVQLPPTDRETPALQISASPRHRDRVQLPPTGAETPALRSSTESYGHSRPCDDMRTCGRRLLARDTAANGIEVKSSFFRDLDC